MRLHVVLIAALVLISGCASPARQAARIESLKSDASAIEREMGGLSESVKKLSDSIAALERETDTLHLRYVEPRLIREGTLRIGDRLDAIGQRIGVMEMRGSGALSIKVLSGDGDISSAKRLSAMLESAGYEVKAMDFAPSANSGPLLVFTTAAARPVALDMIKGLGLKAEIRPLTWTTIFDIILVTGKGVDNGKVESGTQVGRDGDDEGGPKKSGNTKPRNTKPDNQKPSR